MQELWLEMGGRREKVWVQKARGILWVHWRGRTLALNEEDGRGTKRSRSGSGSSHPGKIQAPMPGKIIKVLATDGASVKVGQALLILEAMKMEYTLAADIDGTVQMLKAKVGEQVVLGQILVEIRSES